MVGTSLAAGDRCALAGREVALATGVLLARLAGRARGPGGTASGTASR